jgi:2-dehydropantoate 2-reductase
LLASLAEKDGKQKDDANLSCCAAIYGGMALVCSNRVGPGHIDHSYAGLLSGGVAAAAETNPEADRKAFEDLWQPAKVDIAYEPSLLRGRWKKNVWNLPFNGISVAMGGITIDTVVTDPGLRQLAYIVMDETIAIANEDLRQNGYDESWYLGEPEKKIMMDLSDAMGPYKTSTMLDLVERRPMEVQFLFRKPLERAEKLGVKAPHLETLVLLIEAIQKKYSL